MPPKKTIHSIVVFGGLALAAYLLYMHFHKAKGHAKHKAKIINLGDHAGKQSGSPFGGPGSNNNTGRGVYATN